MNQQEARFILEPTTFYSMREAQELTDDLELAVINLGTASGVLHAVVESFSEIVNNAAEHGMTPEGAATHVRYLPHRRGWPSTAS